ncbi:hypothetical protein ROSA5918_23855 [Roseateles saccharophilus]
MAADMLTVAQAACYARTDVAAIGVWIASGRVIALKERRTSYRLPRWQFDPAIWEAIPRVIMALNTTHGWALMTFLESPCGALGGRTPRHAIEQGHLRQVLLACAAEGH